MPRIRDYAYNRSTVDEKGQALKVTMFEGESVKKEAEENVPLALQLVGKEEAVAEDNIENATEHNEIENKIESIKKIISEGEVKVAKTNAIVGERETMVERIVVDEVDLNPKYSDVAAAIRSITEDGIYYEDYARAANNGLTKDKDFVLSIIAQNPIRFYSPLTPTPSDWLDEEFLTREYRVLFEALKEGENETAANRMCDSLYEFLERAAFNPEAYGKMVVLSKLVAKVFVAEIKTVEEGDRINAATNRYFEAIKNAKASVKARHEKVIAEAKEKAERLKSKKEEMDRKIEERGS